MGLFGWTGNSLRLDLNSGRFRPWDEYGVPSAVKIKELGLEEFSC